MSPQTPRGALIGGWWLLHVVPVSVSFILSCTRTWHLGSEALGPMPGSAAYWLGKGSKFFDPSFLLL